MTTKTSRPSQSSDLAQDNWALKTSQIKEDIHFLFGVFTRFEWDLQDMSIQNRVTDILGRLGAGVVGEKESEQLPLMVAVADRQVPQHLQFLLDHGADVHARSSHQFTALHLAARAWWTGAWLSVEGAPHTRDSGACVTMLLDHGADMNATDSDGLTALEFALSEMEWDENNPLDVGGLRVLIERGADLWAKPSGALSACYPSSHTTIGELILDPNTKSPPELMVVVSSVLSRGNLVEELGQTQGAPRKLNKL